MKADTKLFLVAGLLLALALALFVSPFADSDPDGLRSTTWATAPLPTTRWTASTTTG